MDVFEVDNESDKSASIRSLHTDYHSRQRGYPKFPVDILVIHGGSVQLITRLSVSNIFLKTILYWFNQKRHLHRVLTSSVFYLKNMRQLQKSYYTILLCSIHSNTDIKKFSRLCLFHFWSSYHLTITSLANGFLQLYVVGIKVVQFVQKSLLLLVYLEKWNSNEYELLA